MGDLCDLYCRSYTTVNFSLTLAADPVSVSTLPSAEATQLILYMSFPSRFHVTFKPFPDFATTHDHPAGHSVPFATWSLPSNFASQTPPSPPIAIFNPSGRGVSSRDSGELEFIFAI